MGKYFRGKTRLVLSIAVCSLFVAGGFSTVAVKSADTQVTQTQTRQATTPTTSFAKILAGFKFLNWDFWTNPPNLFSRNLGNIGIGTMTPSAKLDVAGNIAVNGKEIINETGAWVGDTTGMQGPPGPQGPQGLPPAHEWLGTMLRFQNPNGSWGNYTDLQGPQGEQGAQGVQGPPGPQGSPGPTLWGVNGNNIYYNNGSVGIGATSPLAKFQVNSGAVLFSGTAGSTPVSGSGARLMWIPNKYAFRAGYVSGNQWDDSNIGIFSDAMGSSSTASGSHSTAMGVGTIASGSFATAMGVATVASGSCATTMGWQTTANGSCSTALGNMTIASGYGSTAIGVGTLASSTQSTAMGGYTTASGVGSTAMGVGTIAHGNFSTAMGQRITVNGWGSLGIGLAYHSPNWFVNSSNAMSIMGGNVGIGTTSPSAPLDINGNVKTSGDYKYSSPKTYYLNIPAAAFTSLYASGYNYYNTGAYTYQLSGPSTTLVCPVNLPQGAIVTEFRTYTYDNNATYNVELISSLYTQTLTLGVWDLMAKEWLNTSGSSYNIQPTIDTTIQYATIDNSNNQYWIYINFDANTNNNINLRFYGSRITYTMDTIAP
jgi:hypothetical protein